MKNLFLFIFFLTSLYLNAQVQKINSTDISSPDGNIYQDTKGQPLSGKFKILHPGDLYAIGSFINGYNYGFMDSYSAQGIIVARREWFHSTLIQEWEYNNSGEVTSQKKYFNLEVLEGASNNHGLLLDGKVKLTVLDDDYFYNSSEKSRIVSVKNGLYHGDTEIYDEHGHLFKTMKYENDVLKKIVAYTQDKIVFNELIFCDLKVLPHDQNQIKSLDLYIKNRKDENGATIYKDAGGDALNGSYVVLDDDKMIAEGTFINGKREGIHKEYDKETGLMEGKYNYSDGVLNGLHTEYDLSSIKIGHLREGVMHGLFIDYNLDYGFVTDSVNFSNGVKSGLEQKRWTEGQHAKYNYVNGNLHGHVKIYHKDKAGRDYLAKTETYMHGVRQGKFLEYDSAGNVIAEQNYKYDKLHGMVTGRDYEGIKYEEEFKLGTILRRITYRWDGKKNSEIIYQGEKSASISYQYNDKGKLIKTCTKIFDENTGSYGGGDLEDEICR